MVCGFVRENMWVGKSAITLEGIEIVGIRRRSVRGMRA